jgi:PTH2 family peptidyl-tRNA hydrolase
MTPGRMAAQACHAAKNCAIAASHHAPEILRLYQGPDNIGTQIILKAPNEGAILRAYEAAQEAGLICSLIIDQGNIYPGFSDGEPIITALGIGPCTREQANHITKRFSMVQ